MPYPDPRFKGTKAARELLHQDETRSAVLAPYDPRLSRQSNSAEEWPAVRQPPKTYLDGLREALQLVNEQPDWAYDEVKATLMALRDQLFDLIRQEDPDATP